MWKDLDSYWCHIHGKLYLALRKQSNNVGRENLVQGHQIYFLEYFTIKLTCIYKMSEDRKIIYIYIGLIDLVWIKSVPVYYP